MSPHEPTIEEQGEEHPPDPSGRRFGDELRVRLERGLQRLGYALSTGSSSTETDPRSIALGELVEAVLAIELRMPHRVRGSTDELLRDHGATIVSAKLEPQAVVGAVRVLRIVRARSTELVQRPRYASFAEPHVAMLLADELRRMPNLPEVLDDEGLDAVVDEYSLHDRAWLRLSLVLALAGIVEGRASLQTLEWLFGQEQLVKLADSADVEGMRIVDEVSQGLTRMEEQLLEAGLEASQVIEILEQVEQHANGLGMKIAGLVMELGVLPMPGSMQ